MIALMKKDLRIILPVLIGGVILTAMPYALAAASWLLASDSAKARKEFGDALQFAAYAAMWLVTLLSAAFGGAAFAQERQQRSADFLAMLPVRRGRIVFSKAIVFPGLLALLWLLQACAWTNLPSHFHSALSNPHDDTEVAIVSASSLMMVFGVAWLFSSFLASPTWAACIALAWMFALFMAVSLVQSARRNDSTLLVITLSIGFASFVGGTVYYLRRIDP